MLPHENWTPSLPGRTNTGEKYVSVVNDGRPERRRLASFTRYIVQGPGITSKTFHLTPEGFAAAVAYRDAVLAGERIARRDRSIVDVYLDRSRGDGNDRGPTAGERRAAAYLGRHRRESAGIALGIWDEFGTTADAVGKVIQDIGKQQLRRFDGRPYGDVVSVLAADPKLRAFAESVSVVIRVPSEDPDVVRARDDAYISDPVSLRA